MLKKMKSIEILKDRFKDLNAIRKILYNFILEKLDSFMQNDTRSDFVIIILLFCHCN